MQKSAVTRPRFFVYEQDGRDNSAGQQNLEEEGVSSRCHNQAAFLALARWKEQRL